MGLISQFKNILVYIEPWIEDDKPGWKKNYIWWFGEIINALRNNSDSEFSVRFIIGDDCSPYWEQLINTEAGKCVIKQSELKSIHKSSSIALRKWLVGDYTESELNKMMSLVKEKLDGFAPDVIFTITPAPFLSRLFPSSLVLFRDAMYCREPWPDEMTCLDPVGINIEGVINRFSNDLKEISIDEASKKFNESLRADFLNDVYCNNVYSTLLEKYKSKFDKLILLPLQSSGHYNFYSATSFRSQFEYLCYVLDRIPQQIGVVVTDHPDEKTLSKERVEYLEMTYSNFICLNALDDHHAPSQFIIPLVDGMVCVSSGLCYQAIIWNKPVFIVGDSHFAKLFNSLDHLAVNDFTHKELGGVIYWLLTHYFISYQYIKDGAWLTEYINSLSAIKDRSDITLSSFSRIDSDENILKNIFNHKRNIRIFKPGKEGSSSSHNVDEIRKADSSPQRITYDVNAELEHLKKAYAEAIGVQDKLKIQVKTLEEKVFKKRKFFSFFIRKK